MPIAKAYSMGNLPRGILLILQTKIKIVLSMELVIFWV
jgi:hypothetical protein